jgi:uncharacterized damage-inducible protein DinB
MRRRTLVSTLAMLAFAALAPVAAAQDIFDDMHRDVNDVQQKLMQLANAIPESAYSWRPAPGVRSIGEVFLHVAADNYLIPINMGAPAPASTGITSDFATAAAFEKRTLTKAQIMAELQASFVHLHSALGLTTEANGKQMIKFFGGDWTRQRAVILTVTHLHEHLGQQIAYARSNNVKPPWSN